MDKREKLKNRIERAIKRRERLRRRLEQTKRDLRGLRKALAALPPRPRRKWHPNAIKSPEPTPGPFRGGGHKIVWHTTEGHGLPDYEGSTPHFTINPSTNQLWQHLPIDTAAATLKAGTGNFSNSIQVEIIGFARESFGWDDKRYRNLAALARWIERNAKVPARCTVEFSGQPGRAARLSVSKFHEYTGHIGHQHAPSPNDHWDPGHLRIEKILKGA